MAASSTWKKTTPSTDDHGVVLGDDLLAGDVDDLLHHVDLAADAIDEGGIEVEAGLGDLRELAEALDRIAIALADDFHAREEIENDEHHREEGESERCSLAVASPFQWR